MRTTTSNPTLHVAIGAEAYASADAGVLENTHTDRVSATNLADVVGRHAGLRKAFLFLVFACCVGLCTTVATVPRMALADTAGDLSDAKVMLDELKSDRQRTVTERDEAQRALDDAEANLVALQGEFEANRADLHEAMSSAYKSGDVWFAGLLGMQTLGDVMGAYDGRCDVCDAMGCDVEETRRKLAEASTRRDEAVTARNETNKAANDTEAAVSDQETKVAELTQRFAEEQAEARRKVEEAATNGNTEVMLASVDLTDAPELNKRVVELATQYAATRAPYVARMSNGMGEPTDCSGLTLWVFKTAGCDLNAWMPHVQANDPRFVTINEEDAVPGDICFRVSDGSVAPYDRPSCHHAGIYMGNHTVIEERWGGCTWDSLDVNFDTPGQHAIFRRYVG